MLGHETDQGDQTRNSTIVSFSHQSPAPQIRLEKQKLCLGFSLPVTGWDQRFLPVERSTLSRPASVD